MFKSNEFTNNKALLFDEETRTVTIVKIRDQSGNVLETENGVLHLENAKTYVDEKHGGLVYAYNVDLPAKVEALKLKELRRSVSLKRIFEFDKSDGKIDWFKWLPWFIIIILIIKH